MHTCTHIHTAHAHTHTPFSAVQNPIKSQIQGPTSPFQVSSKSEGHLLPRVEGLLGVRLPPGQMSQPPGPGQHCSTSLSLKVWSPCRPGQAESAWVCGAGTCVGAVCHSCTAGPRHTCGILGPVCRPQRSSGYDFMGAWLVLSVDASLGKVKRNTLSLLKLFNISSPIASIFQHIPETSVSLFF